MGTPPADDVRRAFLEASARHLEAHGLNVTDDSTNMLLMAAVAAGVVAAIKAHDAARREGVA